MTDENRRIFNLYDVFTRNPAMAIPAIVAGLLAAKLLVALNDLWDQRSERHTKLGIHRSCCTVRGVPGLLVKRYGWDELGSTEPKFRLTAQQLDEAKGYQGERELLMKIVDDFTGILYTRSRDAYDELQTVSDILLRVTIGGGLLKTRTGYFWGEDSSVHGKAVLLLRNLETASRRYETMHITGSDPITRAYGSLQFPPRPTTKHWGADLAYIEAVSPMTQTVAQEWTDKLSSIVRPRISRITEASSLCTIVQREIVRVQRIEAGVRLAYELAGAPFREHTSDGVDLERAQSAEDERAKAAKEDILTRPASSDVERAISITAFLLAITVAADVINTTGALLYANGALDQSLQCAGALIHTAGIVIHKIAFTYGFGRDCRNWRLPYILGMYVAGCGQVLEATSIILTITGTGLIPAIVLASLSIVMGGLWIFVHNLGTKDNSKMTMAEVEQGRGPYVFSTEMLYIGTVVIAATQAWPNIFLLLPEFPFDIAEHIALRLATEE